MAAFLFGIGGTVLSLLLAGVWNGAAMLFGFSILTPDQMGGMALMLGCGGFAAGAVLAIVFN